MFEVSLLEELVGKLIDREGHFLVLGKEIIVMGFERIELLSRDDLAHKVNRRVVLSTISGPSGRDGHLIDDSRVRLQANGEMILLSLFESNHLCLVSHGGNSQFVPSVFLSEDESSVLVSLASCVLPFVIDIHIVERLSCLGIDHHARDL